MTRLIPALCAAALMTATAQAEVVSSSSARMVLTQEHESTLSKADLWAKLIEPKEWWLHSFSGDPGHMTLELEAGGVWREDWEGGSVTHGHIMAVMHGEMLRLHAPFGPMQEMGLATSLTLSVGEKEGGGSILKMDFVANGAEGSGLTELAPAVDFVWDEALTKLVTDKD
ncbi:hypothetical protein [Parvularcula marina]|uniref:ATPase n=1 Tax=Parvularcula marina TaxID=2292771 RepID=A0A371RFI6_9PROT|nr:hypothetical protein [Parvularcula marina]RFB04203.1 hypothetical protein DX908_02230 [Parvularcula marina]